MQLNVSANEQAQKKICSIELIFFLEILVQVNVSANDVQQKNCSVGLNLFSVNLSAIER